MTDKPFKTIPEQMDILRDRNLKISDPVQTSHLLQAYGYYEIINGYKNPFLTNPHNKDHTDHYIDSTDFSDVFNLFAFDTALRERILGALELFEASLRQAVAYIFSYRHGDNQQNFTNVDFFERGKKNYNESGKFIGYERDGLFKKINKIINDTSDPFKHYRERHGNVPPWIIVKGMTFGNLRMFIHLLKPEDKKLLLNINLAQL